MDTRQALTALILILLFAVTKETPLLHADPPHRTAPTAVPKIKVNQSRIDGMVVVENKIFFWEELTCNVGRMGSARDRIARVTVFHDHVKELFSRQHVNCANSDIRSNIVFDANYAYWMSADEQGLVRLSVTANLGDAPQLVSDDRDKATEIYAFGNHIYLMHADYGIVRTSKTPGFGFRAGQDTTLVTSAELGGTSDHLQITNDLIYWRNGSTLKAKPHAGGAVASEPNATSYIVDQCPAACDIYVAKEHRLYRFPGGINSTLIYQSNLSDVDIIEVVVDDSHVFFWEKREDAFEEYDYVLKRMPRTGGAADTLFFIEDVPLGFERGLDLTLEGPNDDYLYWRENGVVKQLPRDADALDATDIAITNIEVTQGIQDLNQSMFLIRGKRTGVRVHVEADGDNVPGVLADLYLVDAGGNVVDGPIKPLTNFLTVQDNPDRSTMNHAFYFELPMQWVDNTWLRVRADVNLNQLPPESNFANNSQTTAFLPLVPSPLLRIHLIKWEYRVDGHTYFLRKQEDVEQAKSWFRRVYPLASLPPYSFGSLNEGLDVSERSIFSDKLGKRIRQIGVCHLLKPSDRSKCAANHTNYEAGWIALWEGIPNSEKIYGMIPYYVDENGDPVASLLFPRGWGWLNGTQSSGPGGNRRFGWDTDGSSADFYMGHEVAHTLGREHPQTPDADNGSCGHSQDDTSFPYDDAAIGEGAMWGFDLGDPGLNPLLQPRPLPNDQWTDFMGYCNNQWTSDYTYTALFNKLHSSRTARDRAVASNPGSDVIVIFGSIYGDNALIESVGTVEGAVRATSGTGDYSLEFRDENGVLLGSSAFSAETISDSDVATTLQSFQVSTPFNSATRSIELRRNSDNALLTSHAVSASPPVVSNVMAEVQFPSREVGSIAVEWTATDADNPADLSHTLLYSIDDGATWKVYATSLSGTTFELPLANIPGSRMARIRIITSDGSHMVSADSASFTVPFDLPEVEIVSPVEGHSVRFGTQINFAGKAINHQTNWPTMSVEWLLNGNPTGETSSFYTAFNLPTGEHTITLNATNIAGTATDSVTVFVHDDWSDPEPMLGIGPDQLGWHIDSAEMAPPARTLTLSNPGAGSLAWQASESAEWLTLNKYSGTSTPDAIQVTVDPSKLAINETASTTITIQGTNGELVKIPVSFTRGANLAWLGQSDATAPLAVTRPFAAAETPIAGTYPLAIGLLIVGVLTGITLRRYRSR